MKLGVIFGGMSTENKVSILSGTSVIKHLSTEKYQIYPIYIDENGRWYNVKNVDNMDEKSLIENILEFLKSMDVIFPVLHGLYGEDGTIQGMLEMIKKPYVGCNVLASSVGMDKVYTKIIFDRAGLNQAKYVYLRKNNDEIIYIDEKFNEQKYNLDEVLKVIEEKIKYPMFIKPSNSGSSVGIGLANNATELKDRIKEAGKYDRKILIEQGITGKELECAVIGNEKVVASCVGKIKAADEFYSYDAKYKNNESKTIIPAEISKEISDKIKELAVKAFKAIDGKGLSRVDFFLENNTNKIYINEINTLPGFTSISMYPKLFEQSGIKYEELLDRLINLAIEKR